MRALATSKGSPSPVQQMEPATPEAVSCQLILGELPSHATTSPERGPTTSPERTFHPIACPLAQSLFILPPVQANLSLIR